MQALHDNKPRWERRKDARPQELLAAALDQFVERGYAATRLEDVAKRAGVSKGTLYLYFTNKEELFKAVVRGTIVEVIGEAEQDAADFAGHSADLMRELLLRWWNQCCATPLAGITKLMFAEGNNFPELAHFYNEEVVARGTGVIRSVLVRGIARGEFRAVDPDVMTPVLVAPVMMLLMWTQSYMPACEMPPVDPHAYLDLFITTSLAGLAVPAP
ncbi:AcrR family transcriptional regulator [Duganella sp. 3397]|uniref:TetR/AcrR family transcriptional regulator n=1 Tax=Duganella sp. 3397 TaxID=2817732 RepID=UPI002857BE22|nr:TetR/AcrR family transcriptional regulator [Duganella sp. 3397]MDR7050153.1 AcrR family transcriptional regulator [Duganella sp. 3397]